MKINYFFKTDYLKYEQSSDNKICLDICEPYKYGITDSNFFYNLYYTKQIKNVDNTKSEYKKMGNVIYTNIFSYHILCHMFCVEWPKSEYNIIPFKINYFEECCIKLQKYLSNKDITQILCPMFATEIFGGNWNDILKILNKYFEKYNFLIFK